jgi:outer membrane protein assembly factor BamA
MMQRRLAGLLKIPAILLAGALLAVVLPGSRPAEAAEPAPGDGPDPEAQGVPAPAPTGGPLLVVDRVEIHGNLRTGAETVALYFPLAAGQQTDQTGLLAAVEALRRSDLFARVALYTRPSGQRGHIVVVLDVVEQEVEVRLGTGYDDLDGWYLIPAQLSLPNRLGRGERLDLQLELGYRRSGLALEFSEPRLGDGATYWGVRGAILAIDRIYFYRQVEYAHRVDQQSAAVHLGRRLGGGWFTEIGLAHAQVSADSTAQVHRDDESRQASAGDELTYDELPAGVAAAVGSRQRSSLRLDVGLDTRSRWRLAGSPVGGLWGKVGGAAYLQGDQSFLAASLDLRGYARLLRGVVALRLRADAVGDQAAFYDRLYLGGLYTVRGYPSQSLSRPAGDLWRWTASCEYRAPLLGETANPRLAGLLFIDVGAAGDGRDPYLAGAVAGAGWGVRLRVPWLGWLGFDVGLPLSPSPLDDSFHVHGSIGWTF